MGEAQEITGRRSRAADRAATEQLGLPGVVLMENAGRSCVDLLQMLGATGPFVVCCGKGANGGDGLVIARHLVVRGLECRVWLAAGRPAPGSDAAVNLKPLERLGLSVREGAPRDAAADLRGAGWIIDALLGVGTTGDPRSPVRDWIEAINTHARENVLAIDTPSGWDSESGRAGRPTVRAAVTATMIQAKLGYSRSTAAEHTGQVYVVDIGVPQQWLLQRG